MIIEGVMLAIKISFFGNCGSHQNYQKGNFVSKWFLRWLCRPSKISFFGNCGSHHCLYNPSNCQKGKFIPKWFLRYLYQPSKLPFFSNCGSMIAYISHQKFPKKEIPFLEGHSQLHIKLFPFGEYYIIHQIFLFW